MSRTIIIGDVHGCARELADLLDLLALTSDDCVRMVGDLVVRGPDPRGVIELVRSVGALTVLGNHEYRLLRWREMQRGKEPVADAPAYDRRIMKSKQLRRTATELDDACWEYIEQIPLWLDEPEHQLRVVHAGVLPGVAIEEQTRRTLLYLRSIDAEGQGSELREAGTPWGAHYHGPPHVVFGHNANFEPQLHAWATGIDTGCVYGGRLTALVLGAGEHVPKPDDRHDALVSVKAREIYYAIR
jgi:hypothetical protein